MLRMWNVLQLLNAADVDERRQRRLALYARRRNQRINLIRHIADDQFCANYRMHRGEFNFLCAQLMAHTELKASYISLEVKVLTSLSFLAMGSYQKGVAKENFMTQTTVSKCLREVIVALNHPAIINQWIQFPLTREEKDTVKHGFYAKFGFPGVLGAIDCTHVAIVRPRENEPCFYNRKGYHSLNVQMICDSNLKILNVNPKFGGATHDSHIWTTSIIRPHVEALQRHGETAWLLGDSGYPQRSYLMTPILNAAAGSREDQYNTLHVKSRNCIERTFGVLKSRFRCILKQRVLYYDPDYAAEIIIACSVLHNMLTDLRGAPAPADDIPEENNFNDIIEHVLDNNNDPDLIVGRSVREQLIIRLFNNN